MFNRIITAVRYDSKKKKYLAENGRLRGITATRSEAEEIALEHDMPQLLKELQDILQQMDSADLLPVGEVEAVRQRGFRAIFNMRDGETHAYTIRHDGEDYTCTCSDFAWRAPQIANGQKVCKHILAMILTEKAQAANLAELIF